jgi:hypothetical protein
VLGYCIFPLVLAALVTMFVTLLLVRIVMVAVAFMWATRGSVCLLTSSGVYVPVRARQPDQPQGACDVSCRAVLFVCVVDCADLIVNKSVGNMEVSSTEYAACADLQRDKRHNPVSAREQPK